MKDKNCHSPIGASASIVGAQLKRIRLSRGSSIFNVSRQVDIPVYVISRIEEGAYPDLQISVIYSMSRNYNASVLQLFREVE